MREINKILHAKNSISPQNSIVPLQSKSQFHQINIKQS